MASYEYRALNSQGKTVKGVLDGESERHLRQLLREKGLTALDIQALNKSSKPSTSAGGSFFKKKLAVSDVSLFTRELYTLLEASTPLNQALKALSEQAESKTVLRFISGLHQNVNEGYGLAQALMRSDYSVPQDYIAIIQAGEESGHLTAVMSRLADNLEQRDHLNKKLKTALIYPILMIVVAVAIVFFLMVYVVPKVVTVFDNMQQELPPLTQGLLSASDFVQGYWWLMIGGVIGIWILLQILLRIQSTRFKIHALLMRTPGIKRFLIYSATSRWARTLGVLVDSGVAVRESMVISAEVMTLAPMRKAVDEMVEKIRQGKSVHSAMRQAGFFPPLLLNLVQTGEGKGQLHTMLLKGAQHYEMAVEQAAQTLVSLLEPLLIIVMGAVVLTIVLAIMLPIFEMNQMVG